MTTPAFVPAFVTAAQTRDEAGLRTALAPTFNGTANGRPIDAEAQVALIRSFWTGFPEGTITMEAIGGHGRYVITWKVAGPHGGDYLGIPATGHPVEISGFTTARSDAVGIQEMAWKWDTKTFARAVLGPELVLPPEAPTPKRHLVAPWEQGQRGRGPSPGQGRGRQGGQPNRRGRNPPAGAAASEPGPAGEPGATGEPGAAGEPVLAGGARAPAGERQPGNRRRGQRQPRGPRTGDATTPAAAADAPRAEAVAAAPPAEPAAEGASEPKDTSSTP